MWRAVMCGLLLAGCADAEVEREKLCYVCVPTKGPDCWREGGQFEVGACCCAMGVPEQITCWENQVCPTPWVLTLCPPLAITWSTEDDVASMCRVDGANGAASTPCLGPDDSWSCP